MVEILEFERPRKRLFLALLALSLCVVGGIVYAVWHVSYLGLSEISRYLPLILGGLLAAVFLFTGLGLVGIVGAILGVPYLSHRHYVGEGFWL